jgi:hypothetical protein
MREESVWVGEKSEEGERRKTNRETSLLLQQQASITATLFSPSSSSLPYLLVAAEGAFSVSSGGKTLSRTTKPTVPLGQPVRMPAETRKGGKRKAQ